MPPTVTQPLSEKNRANWLFVDINSYFASVEQETRPELRGKPIGIVPIEAKTACVIAASYQAKAYGVKTGMRADEALQVCPHIQLVQARPKLYVEYHHKIAQAIQLCIPIRDVMSCDEFASELMGRERHLPNASDIAYKIKQAIREQGKSLRCSVGLGPNRLLAKIAADMQKPDGLMVIERRHLPGAQQSRGPPGAQRQDDRVNDLQSDRGRQSDRLCQARLGGAGMLARTRRMLPGKDDSGAGRARVARDAVRARGVSLQ